MLKSFVVTTVFSLFAMSLHAQDFSVSGRVVSSTSSQALGGATVQLDETNRYAVTDEFGRFQFSKVASGPHTLTIKFVGFEPKQHLVNVTNNTQVEIALEESTQLTDEVIVYATRAGEKTPTTYSNVSQQAIEKQNLGQDLPFLLNWTPSLVTTSDAGAGIGYTGIRIRGSDASRINVTINGIPYNDSESQGTFWVNIADIASSVQSVQIQRGVGTSTNGAGAFGASVNLQTTTLNTEPYADISFGGGSFNTLRTVARAGTGLIKNRFAFDGRISRINSDGYIERASSDLRSYFFSGGYYGKSTIVKGIVFGGHEQTYQAWYGVDADMMKTNRRFNYAGAIYDADGNITRYHKNEEDNYKQDHYQLHIAQQLDANWTANMALHYTYGRGFYEQYLQGQALADFGLQDIVLNETTITNSDLVVRKWLDNDFYGTTFSFNYDKNRTALTIGGGYNEYANAKHFGEIIWAQYASNSTLGQRWYAGESKKQDFNIYSKLNYSLTTALHAYVDLQYRKVDYETAGVDDDLSTYAVRDNFNFFNPKAGLSYTFNDNSSLYASYAVAHREPNRTDYLDGFEKPRAERLDNIEIGFRKTSNWFTFEANYYLMNYTDQLVLTGMLNDVGSPIRANVGKSYRTGIELSGGLRLSDKVTWNLNATFSQNKNKDYVVSIDDENQAIKKNTTIILSPSIVSGSQLTWTAVKNLDVALLSKYVGKQYLDNTQNDQLALDGYYVQDVRLSYNLEVKGMRGIEASLLVNNVFNKAYASNGYAWGDTPYFYPQATRNFLAMLTVKF